MKRIINIVICVVIMVITAAAIYATIYVAKNTSVFGVIAPVYRANNDDVQSERDEVKDIQETESKENTANSNDALKVAPDTNDIAGSELTVPLESEEDSLVPGENPEDPILPSETIPYEEEEEQFKFNPIVKGILFGLTFLFMIAFVFLLVSRFCSINPFGKPLYVVIFVLLLACGTYFGGTTLIKLNEDKPLNTGIKVSASNINLNSYNDNITINSPGIYNITGSFDHSVIVKANGNVILKLNNVNINAPKGGAIVCAKCDSLTVTTENGSINNLTNKGSKNDYDGVIYSVSSLSINGDGILNITANQEDGEGISTTDASISINGGNIGIVSKDDGINSGGKNAGSIFINGGELYINASGDGIDSNSDLAINGGKLFIMGSENGGNAGIDTDDGFVINGGSVVALGTDMLEVPKKASTQKFFYVTLEKNIDKNKEVVLVNNKNKAIVGFMSPKFYKTIIVSTADIEKGEYNLLINPNKSETIKLGLFEPISYSKWNKIDTNQDLSVE